MDITLDLRHTECSRISTVCFIVGQSDRLPMITPTTGVFCTGFCRDGFFEFFGRHGNSLKYRAASSATTERRLCPHYKRGALIANRRNRESNELLTSVMLPRRSLNRTRHIARIDSTRRYGAELATIAEDPLQWEGERIILGVTFGVHNSRRR